MGSTKPRSARPGAVQSKLYIAQAEIATLRVRVAELEGTPHRLRLLAEIPAGEALMGVELDLLAVCRASLAWLAALVALADACGPATFIEALRRFDPVAHKKAQRRMAKKIHRLERETGAAFVAGRITEEEMVAQRLAHRSLSMRGVRCGQSLGNGDAS
jgi:hypothetical protein